MQYVPPLFRPPSEANALILQATIGCSWNKCTYCHMYRTKPTMKIRPADELVAELEAAADRMGDQVQKLFVADGDALVMPTESHWLPILAAARRLFPRLRRVSCYAMASNVLDKTPAELGQLQQAGLSLLYMGPESGDEVTMKRIAKGSVRTHGPLYAQHVNAAAMAREAGIKISAIFLLGAGGVERSQIHAQASAQLATDMDPAFLAALTLTVVPGTPQAVLQERGRFVLPEVEALLEELRTFVWNAAPSGAVFRTNHASNYLPLGGRLPRDRERICGLLDAALDGAVPLRPEWSRGL